MVGLGISRRSASSKKGPSHGVRKKRLTRRTIMDNGIRGILFLCAFFSIIVLSFIVIFLFQNAYPVVSDVLYRTDYGYWESEPIEFFVDDEWMPHTDTDPSFGARALIVGTVLVSLGAMAIAIPLGLGSAIFISQLAPSRIKGTLKTGIELLAGVPSVVYGLFGLIVLVRWIKVNFDQPSGASWLAGSVLLGIMALPTIISVSEDAMSAVTREQKEASLALGATKWQTISKVIIPGSISGITAAVILGIGRAMGETMAVMMVTGNTAIIPDPITDIFSTVKTITGAIGIEMGEATGDHQSGLFMLAVILFLLVLIINSTAIFIMNKIKSKHLGLVKKKKKGAGYGIVIPDSVKSAAGWALKGIGVVVIFLLLKQWFSFYDAVLITGLMIGWFVVTRFLSPKINQWLYYGLISITMLLTLASLGVILYYIFSEGIASVSPFIEQSDYGYWRSGFWDFLYQSPEDLGRAGGIKPAIIGTFYLVGGAILLAMPIGVGAGIYLSEYAREGRLLKIIRLGIDNLNGTPSIVFGLFAFAFLVIYLELGVSLIAGIIILGIMVLPTIIRTTEESLKSVPQSVREGSLALGATKWETIWKVVLPPAYPGIITGIILSIGRAAGESAPILFVSSAFITAEAVSSLSNPTMALSTHIFYLSAEIPRGLPNASGTALVLIILILIIYSLAAWVRNKFHKRNRW